ncbi:NitT/TauT family transport system substrate-binding protein [Azospirillaceae bacterium]
MKCFFIFVAIFMKTAILWGEACHAESPKREALSLGVAENAGNILTFIALEQGFYRDEGLEVTTRSWPAGKMALEAMLRNEIEVATVADTPIVLQSFQRSDFVIIATFSHNNPYRLVTDRKGGIVAPTDLRGHRVGVMTGTTAQFFLHSILADLGIASSEITEVNLPAAESSEALAQNRVDAVAAFDPYGYYAQVALGDRAIIIPYEKGRHEETFNYATRRDFSQKRPVAAQCLLRATQRAIEWSRNHRHEAVAVVARRLKMDEKILETLWGNSRHALSLDQVLIVSLESQARWAIRNGIGNVDRKATIPNYLDFLDTSPLDAVMPSAVTIIR